MRMAHYPKPWSQLQVAADGTFYVIGDNDGNALWSVLPLHFRHPGGSVHNRTNIEPGIDLRGDGGCIVAPPSIHPSGKRYRWKKGHGPGEIAPAPLPDWLH